MRDSAIFDYVLTRAWLLEAGVLNRMVKVLERHHAGVKLSEEEISAISSDRETKSRKLENQMEISDGVATIPISGVLAKHASQVNGSSQPRGSSYGRISADLKAAVADEDVHSILLAIDSPGGVVDGAFELADEIREARGQKRIVAVADGVMASAAYLLGSQAGEIVATRGSELGSIGVLAVVEDTSRQAANEGRMVHVVRAGRFKGGMVPDAQINADALGALAENVEGYYEMFLQAVEGSRGMSRDDLMQVAEGRVFVGKKAVDAGLADRLGKLADVRERLHGEASAAGRVVAGPPRCSFQEDPMGQQVKTEAAQSASTSAAAPAGQSAVLVPAMTLDVLRASHPDLVRMLTDEGIKAGETKERERVAKLYKASAGASREVLTRIVADGVSVEDGLMLLLEDSRAVKTARLGAWENSTPAPVAVTVQNSVETVKTAGPNAEPVTDEDRWKAEFKASKGLQAEFGDVETYIGFNRHVPMSMKPKEVIR